MNFVIIGTTGVGKSMIGITLAQKYKLNVIDSDYIFQEQYGSITSYGNKNSWNKYFRKQSEIIENIFSNIDQHINNIIVLPASSLMHHRYPDICISNLSIVSGSIIILISPTYDIKSGYSICSERISNRGYELDFEDEKKKYLYQSLFYRSICDIMFINNSSIDEIAYKIHEYINSLLR